MRKKDLLIILVLILAAFPRGIELLNGNYLFTYDHGVFFQAVRKIVVDHKLTLIGTEVGGQGGFFQGPGWYYLLAIPFLLTGGNPYGGMVLMFLSGILTVFFAFLFGQKIFDFKTGLAISFLIAISPGIIPQSRSIWPPYPISLLSVFFIFFLFKIFQKKKSYLPLFTLVTGLMSHFEIATAGTLAIQFFILSPILFIKKLVSWRYFLLSIGSFLLTLSPLIIFDLRHDFLNTKGIFSLFFGKHYPASSWGFVLKNHLEVFQHNFTVTFYFNSISLPIIIVVLVLGFIFYLKDKSKSWAQKTLIVYLATTPVLLYLILIFYRSGLWDWWLLELQIFYCFLFGSLLIKLLDIAKIKIFIYALFLFFFVSFLDHTINLYKNDFNDYGGTHKIKGRIDALDYIYKDAKGQKFSLFIFSPPIYTYPYDYLLWWHGEKKYGYQPRQQKKGLFYLLIEKDPSQPWTYQGWLETVIKTGKIVETQELPSGFIVQKRTSED